MNKWAGRWVDYMILNGADEGKRAVYLYGMECFLNELVSNCLLLFCALLLHRIWEMLVWIVVFTSLRVNAGGIHASSHGACIGFSTLTGCICVLAYPVFCRSFFLTAACAGISIVIVLLFAPVIHKNHPVSDQKKKSARIWAISIAAADTIAVFILYPLAPLLAAMILAGFLSASLMISFALFQKL